MASTQTSLDLTTLTSPEEIELTPAGSNVEERQVSRDQSQADKKLSRFLQIALCAWVLALSFYQFSETTADPDLWGHVAFGQEMLKSRSLERTETYSWTANGQPFINHEYGADLILGGTHLLLGGSGILFLKVGIGLLTFVLCVRLGMKGISWPASAIAWAVGAVAVVEISYGFAARPQIFTALCLVLVLLALRRIHEGARVWALALPVLFVLWINIHGGALAGVGLVLLATGATTVQFINSRPLRSGQNLNSERDQFGPDFKTVASLWLTGIGVIAALFCNPWGAGMVGWLIKSVLWLRPEIEEWNPAPLNWDHAALFILIGVAAFAWAASRRKRAWWELAVCAAFAVLALRSVRNAPLFGVVALALIPPHLADALLRFKENLSRLVDLWDSASARKLALGVLLVSGGAIVLAAFTLHKEHPFTMEVPRSRYPTAAVEFMRAQNLRGNLLVFFDWGDLALFNLPGSKVSIDGRLDACYSRPLIDAHWKFYNGDEVDETILPIDRADFALLPSNLAGAVALRHRPGWRPIYFDNTAVILARDSQRFASLAGLHLPVGGPKTGTDGRAKFADQCPLITSSP